MPIRFDRSVLEPDIEFGAAWRLELGWAGVWD